MGRPRPGAREAIVSTTLLPQSRGKRSWWATRCVTPRQTCPRPSGFGRNLRSKTRWFTGFCNSHQVSHFATFFIDARAEISVAESRLCFLKAGRRPHRRRGRAGADKEPPVFSFLGAVRAGVQFTVAGHRGPRSHRSADRELTHPYRLPRVTDVFAGCSAGQVSTMILPQVHLRKPCYDFSFL